jgi:hypothetical protein
VSVQISFVVTIVVTYIFYSTPDHTSLERQQNLTGQKQLINTGIKPAERILHMDMSLATFHGQELERLACIISQ